MHEISQFSAIDFSLYTAEILPCSVSSSVRLSLCPISRARSGDYLKHKASLRHYSLIGLLVL